MQRAGQNTDDGAETRQSQSEQHRNSKSVHQPRSHIATAVIGTQPVVHRGGRWVRLFGKVIQRAVVVRNDGVKRPIAGLRELRLDKGIQEVRRRVKVPAKRGLRQVVDDGHIKTAVVARKQGFVVAQHLGK